MSRKYKFHDNDKLYFISFAVVNWIDFFIREEYSQEIIKSWQYSIEIDTIAALKLINKYFPNEK